MPTKFGIQNDANYYQRNHSSFRSVLLAVLRILTSTQFDNALLWKERVRKRFRLKDTFQFIDEKKRFFFENVTMC
jgi:hypothetical protein